MILTLLSSHKSLAAEAKLIRVGAFDNYPVIFKDTDGGIKGFYVDLLSEIEKKENYRFEYVFGSWNEGLERIEKGEVDLLTSVAYTDERSQYMDYTETPVLTVWGELYALKSTDIDGMLKVSDKKIGVMKGDINAENFLSRLQNFEISCQVMEFGSYDEIFDAIKKGEIDAGVAGITFGMANEMKYGLKSTGVVFNPLSLYFTAAKDKNQDLLQTLDKYLSEWKAKDNSTYYQAKQRWMRGTVDVVTAVPEWLRYVFIGFGLVFLVALVFIVLLRIQVGRATRKIKDEAEALRESEKKYEFLVERMQEMAIIVDQKGLINFVNQSTCKILGYPEEEILGKSITDFILPEFQQIALTSMEEEFRGNPQPGFEVEVKNKTGEVKILQISDASNPIIKDEKIVGVLVNAIDITKQKEAEKKLVEAKTVLESKVEELEKINKLTIGRELKMVELKEEVEELKKQK